jgi:hypothetical protein
LKFESNLLDDLTEIAESLSDEYGTRFTRSETIRVLVQMGVDIYHEYRKIGVKDIYTMKKRTGKAVSKALFPELF